MRPKSEHIKLAQRILGVKDDGHFGPISTTAAVNHLGEWDYKGNCDVYRVIAAIIQREAEKCGIDAGMQDAYWGPQTADAAYRMIDEAAHTGWRPDELGDDSNAPTSAIRCWTPSEAQMVAKYGQVGTNQVAIDLPYPMRLDWDLSTVVNQTMCHKSVACSLVSALEEIHKHYGDEIRGMGLDRFGGVLNVRKKRGGTTWSSHAWGTAIDLWPSANQLAWKANRSAFSRKDYAPMREAFARHGWMSLGTCYDFDWMHFQKNP